jgi:hypothetical protein
VASVTLPASATIRPWQQRRSVRACYVLILLALAGCAFTDSFVALAELARATGALPGQRAYTLPLMLDGLTLAGTLFAVTRFGPGQGSPAYGYALIAIGSLASLAGNIAHAPDTLAARVIAGAPPLILFLVFEAAAISFRRRPAATPAASGAARVGSGAASGEPGGVPAVLGAASGAAPAASGADAAASGADAATKRLRAQRIYHELTADGGQVTGARLAEAADLSPSYARELVAEFTSATSVFPAELPGPPERNGHTNHTTRTTTTQDSSEEGSP